MSFLTLTYRLAKLTPALLAWNFAVASIFPVSVAVLLLGRIAPDQVTRIWLLPWTAASCVTLAWLLSFSKAVVSATVPGKGQLVRILAIVEGPPLVVAVAGTFAAYLSDELNHFFLTLLYPTPAIAMVVALSWTLVAQRSMGSNAFGRPVFDLPYAAFAARARVVPMSLLLIGLLQGSSYLWVLGSDFLRYWAVADALGAGAGYPALPHMPVYIQAGMAPYSVELPVFPALLLASFALAGHDALGAHLPALVANTLLPWLTYLFYLRAGLSRPLAFASACAVALLPYFRLYTLNAPLPDAVFVALLVATGWAFLRVLNRGGPIVVLADSPAPKTAPEQSPAETTGARADWVIFGALAGFTALTRPEGLVYVAVMFIGLAPHLFRLRFYWALGPFLLLTVSFSSVMVRTFGILWPNNLGSAFGLRNVTANLDWLGRYSVPRYAEPLGLSEQAFVAVVVLLTIAGLVGVVGMAVKRWQLALLPIASILQSGFVFTIDRQVAGADQWFDFYRHVSYGTPFVAIAMLLTGKRTLEFLVVRLRGRGTDGRVRAAPRVPVDAVVPMLCLAIVLLALSVFELRLLAYPSKSYGHRGSQLLTSDIWVSLPDIVANRYELPRLNFKQDRDVVTIDWEPRYVGQQQDRVRTFFEPVSSLATGRGSGYQLSSLVLVLFGAVVVFAGERVAWQKRTPMTTVPASARP